MAESGTFYSDYRTYGGVKARLKISWVLNSQSIANNTSNVTAKVYLDISQGSICATGSGKLYIDSSSSSFSHSSTCFSSDKLLDTYTKTISHNSDGTGEVKFDATYSNNWWGSIGITAKTYNLPTIPRNSAVSTVSSFNLGSILTINTNRKSTSFTHTIKLISSTFSKTYTGVGASLTIDTSVFEAELASIYINSQSTSITISCSCYNGSTLIGTSTAVTTAYFVEIRMMPTITNPTFTESNSAVIALNLPALYFVQNVSKINIGVGPMTLKYGATANKYNLTWGTNSYSFIGNTGTITNVIPKDISNPILFGNDSRGFNSNVITSKNVKVIPYEAPTSNEVLFERQNGIAPIIELTLSLEISLVKVNSVIKNSVKSLQWRYALKGTTSWSSWDTIRNWSFDDVTGEVSLTNSQVHNSLSPDNSYITEVRIVDKFNTEVFSGLINKATPTMSIKSNIVAINKQAEIGKSGLDIIGDLYVNNINIISEINGVKSKNTTQDNSITSLGTRATNLETRATNIETKNTTQDNRLTDIENGVGKILIQYGSTTITPVANTPTSKTITFPKAFASSPVVFTNADTTVPGTVIQTSAQGATTTSFKAYIYRTNTTVTTIDWIAIGLGDY